MRWLGTLSLFVLAGGVAPVSAQAAPDSLAARFSDSLATAIGGAARLRFYQDGARGEAQQPGLRGDSLIWRAAQRLDFRSGRWLPVEPPLALADVSRIDVARGTRVGRGALIGAGIGLGLGLLLAVTEPSNSYAHPGAGGMVTFSVLGAAVGAVVGSMSRHWETIYQRP